MSLIRLAWTAEIGWRNIAMHSNCPGPLCNDTPFSFTILRASVMLVILNGPRIKKRTSTNLQIRFLTIKGKKCVSRSFFGVSNRLEEETMWMRSCAVCKVLLRKLRLCDSVRCQCGWEWQGHAQ